MSLIAFQQALKVLGYDPGPVDGLWGGVTERATRDLLQAKGAPGPLRVPTIDVPPVTAPVIASTSGRVIYQGAARYLVDEIVLHCSDTRPEWMQTRTFKARVAELRRWHIEDRGWKDIGYHWVIDRNGLVLPGRTEGTIGAGVEGHNRGVIHICLLGGHGSAETDQLRDYFTADQGLRLRDLIAAVQSRTPITRISGHNEWAAKACPGFYVPAWLKEKAA